MRRAWLYFFAIVLTSLLGWATGCSYNFEDEFRRANEPTGRAYVHGFVRLPDGTPLEDARVLGLTNKDHATIERKGEKFHVQIESYTTAKMGVLHRADNKGIWTSETGEFRVDTADVQAVVVYHERGFTEIPIEQQVDPLQITLQPWAKVEGTLRIGSKPAEDVMVMAERSGGSGRIYHWRTTFWAFAMTDEEGRFVLDRVPAGEVHVARCRNNNPQGGVWLDARGGAVHQVAVGGNGRPVVGRLVPPAPLADEIDWLTAHVSIDEIAPAGRMFASVKERKEEMRRIRHRLRSLVEIEEDGRFHIEDLPTGRYCLNITLIDRGTDPGQPATITSFVPAILEIAPFPPEEIDRPLDVGDLRLQVQR